LEFCFFLDRGSGAERVRGTEIIGTTTRASRLLQVAKATLELINLIELVVLSCGWPKKIKIKIKKMSVYKKREGFHKGRVRKKAMQKKKHTHHFT
jgi:hypothetical protein